MFQQKYIFSKYILFKFNLKYLIFKLNFFIIFSIHSINKIIKKKIKNFNKKYIVVNNILISVNGYSINYLPNHVDKMKLLINIQ